MYMHMHMHMYMYVYIYIYIHTRLNRHSIVCHLAHHVPVLFLPRTAGLNFGGGNLWQAENPGSLWETNGGLMGLLRLDMGVLRFDMGLLWFDGFVLCGFSLR